MQDNRVRWPDYDSVHRFTRAVAQHYRGRDITFLLSGGEITLWPQLPRMAADLRALGIDVAALSNGTRPLPLQRLSRSGFGVGVDRVETDVLPGQM
ncbi:hypothetical protein [Nocardia gipuzkoensis]|uniref:hypothetical protein n=1 Tax=Nocardia gipuzkoensis TaxID=2749991 RepID=UPI001F368D72|nr:hypothetical protein [Nocardia gipuzkoensis]